MVRDMRDVSPVKIRVENHEDSYRSEEHNYYNKKNQQDHGRPDPRSLELKNMDQDSVRASYANLHQ